MRLLTCGILLFACQIALLRPEALAAQGPKPVGIQQPAKVIDSSAAKFAAPTRGESGRVLPNHWKRGATIGAIVGTVPVAIYLASRAGGDDDGYALFIGTGILSLTGFIGWITGGLIGSFFPK